MRSTPLPIVFTNAGTITTAMPTSGTLLSQIFPIAQAFGYAIQLFWIGSPTGNWSIQGSNDNGFVHSSGIVTGVTNFTTVLNSSSAAGGAAGNLMENLDGQFYQWFQVVYTATSGTGTITSAMASVKGI